MSTTGRFLLGGGAADFAIKPTGSSPFAGAAAVNMWSAQSGGTRYTDLLQGDGVTAQTFVTSNSDGSLPPFYTPAGVPTMWADAGSGNRYRITADLTNADLTGGVTGATPASILAKIANSITPQDFNPAAGDCTQPGATIALTSGSPSATLSTSIAGLKVGHTLVTDTAGNYIVSAVSGTAVTLTTNATATSVAMKFTYGTDCTAAMNSMFVQAVTKGRAALIPVGRYLITGTIGILEPGNGATGWEGLTLITSGMSVNSMRLSYMSANAGTTIFWGGAAGGTMVQICRVVGFRQVGGWTLSGQATYDSGSEVAFGPQAGVPFHLSQNSTPLTGTGYCSLDDICCERTGFGPQFGTNLSDNNCDTTLINRLILWHAANGLHVLNTQGLSYRVNWLHGVSVPGYTVKFDDGGGAEFGCIHLSACGTASGTPTADTYCLDLASSVNGYGFKVGLLRIESGTTRVAAVRNKQTHLQVSMFIEANISNMDDCLFYQQGGTIQIDGGQVKTFFSAGHQPFYLSNDTNSSAPRLALREVSLPVPDNPNTIINLSNDVNVVADYSLTNVRDLNKAAYPDYHSRLERGRTLLGGATTDATSSIQLDPMLRQQGSSWSYSYGPRVGKGTYIVDITLIGDHASTSPSIFKRRLVFYRGNTGNATLISTTTLDTDVVSGTDQIASLTVNTTFHTINLQVKGTASTTVNWRASCSLVHRDPGSLTPDY